MKHEKMLAVITARAGSKGVPGKNYRNINGKPLFLWSVEAALASKNVDRIVVSTNDPWVKQLTAYCWARLPEASVLKLLVVDRPDEISGDQSKNEDALIHAVQSMRVSGYEFDWVMNLQPTSPVRNNDLIDKCCDTIFHSQFCDSLFTASQHTPFFYDRTAHGIAVPIFHDPCKRTMRQNVPESSWFWHDSGNLYITKCDILESTKCRTAKVPYIYPTDFYQSWQIDNEHDFAVLETLSKSYGPFVNEGYGKTIPNSIVSA